MNQTDEEHSDAAQKQLPDGRVNHTDELHSDAAQQQLPDGRVHSDAAHHYLSE